MTRVEHHPLAHDHGRSLLPERTLLAAIVQRGLDDRDSEFIHSDWFALILQFLGLEAYIAVIRAQFPALPYRPRCANVQAHTRLRA